MNKKSQLMLLPLSVLALASCQQGANSGAKYTQHLDHTATLEISSSGKNDGIIRPEEVEISETYQTIVNKRQYNTQVLPSTGDVNILVVPVMLPGYEEIDIDGDELDDSDKVREDIQKSFFSEDENDDFFSVKEFYKQSSFGKLNINGEVTDYVYVNEDLETTYETAASITLSDTYDLVNEICDFLSEAKGYNLADYDNNKDGYIDGIWCIYSCPDYSNGGPNTDDKNFWAYTSWGNQTTSSGGRAPDVEKPVYNLFGWASYDFMYEGYGLKKLDTHTFIHETGHFLGLSDYYSDTTTYNPVGKVDMMDSNIIDINSYAKMLLGWTKPYIAIGDGKITINSMQNENSLIVVPDDSFTLSANSEGKYEFDPFGEYMVIELYTNEGLNYPDSKVAISDRPLAMSDVGARMYHIDNRKYLVNSEDKTDIYSKLYEGETIDSKHKLILPISNSRNIDTYNTYLKVSQDDNLFDEIRVIEASKKNTFNYGGYQTNKTLFKSGDQFTMSEYNDFFINENKMDSGNSFSKIIDFREVK